MKHKHHIIPRHIGGTDDPSNIAHLTPEEHADAHKKLWEQYERWQDYCAWQGLAKLSTNKEHYSLVMTEKNKASWKDPKVRAKRIAAIKKARGHDTRGCKTYKVTMPTGKTKTITSLKAFCKTEGLKYNSFWRATIADNREFNGYKAKLTA
jgi:hypothetical protein